MRQNIAIVRKEGGREPAFLFTLNFDMEITQKIHEIIEAPMESMGYSLVLVKLSDGSGRKTLTVMAERKDDAPMGIEDCTKVSRQIGALLEVEDPITTAYDLEVCSPGIDRPLTRLADYTRYKGEEAKLETYAPLNPADNRKRFRGELLGVSGNTIRIRVDNDEVEIPFSDIRTARLAVSETILNTKKKR
jgi:ribosome maturation factor RimP